MFFYQICISYYTASVLPFEDFMYFLSRYLQCVWKIVAFLNKLCYNCMIILIWLTMTSFPQLTVIVYLIILDTGNSICQKIEYSISYVWF